METDISEAIGERLKLAKAAAREAGCLALGYLRDRAALHYEAKENGQDIVSRADREAEELLRARIAAHFPDDGVFGEEFGYSDGSSGFTWVMDPIDGTSMFVFGMPNWCVSVAVIYGEGTVAGVVYAPSTDELFSASTGEPFTVDGVPLRIDPSLTLQNAVLGVGISHRVPSEGIAELIRRLLDEGGMFIRNGSGALMLAYVAAGRLAGYYEPHMNAWDCLAGLFLVDRAGGWAAEFPGPGSLRDGGPVAAAAPGARADLCRLIEASERATEARRKAAVNG
jgi:myo-inositol-1(or 4)-monophosphatase